MVKPPTLAIETNDCSGRIHLAITRPSLSWWIKHPVHRGGGRPRGQAVPTQGLNRKPSLSPEFWFSTPKVRPDPMFGIESKKRGYPTPPFRSLRQLGRRRPAHRAGRHRGAAPPQARLKHPAPFQYPFCPGLGSLVGAFQSAGRIFVAVNGSLSPSAFISAASLASIALMRPAWAGSADRSLVS